MSDEHEESLSGSPDSYLRDEVGAVSGDFELEWNDLE